MRARIVILGLILWSIAGGANASERAAALVNSFQVMCTIDPLDFTQSDAKATAMRLPVRKDLSSPVRDARGSVLRSKSWLLPLTSGSHEFFVAEARGPKGDVRSCGIGALDVEPDDFRAELAGKLRLANPTIERLSADGSNRVTVWAYQRGNRMTLVDQSPKGRPGIYMLLKNQTAER